MLAVQHADLLVRDQLARLDPVLDAELAVELPRTVHILKSLESGLDLGLDASIDELAVLVFDPDVRIGAVSGHKA
ncbi:hypothetical protein D3C73_1608930 [compost metagenome]